MKTGVCGNYSNNGNSRKVKTLRNHLCTDKNIGITGCKLIKNFDVGTFTACGVLIHTQDKRMGRLLFNILLCFLDTGALIFNLPALAFRAHFRRMLLKAAEMTLDRIVILVIPYAD